MSGYGRATGSWAGGLCTCEVRSTNARNLDCVVSLPPGLAHLERDVRAAVSARIRRGRVEVSVSLSGAGAGLSGVAYNSKLARALARALKRLSRETGLALPDAGAVAQMTGVFTRSEDSAAVRRAERLVSRLVALALGRAAAMRRREGRFLARDKQRRITSLEREAERAGRAWPAAMRLQAERQRARVRKLLERLGAEGGAQALKELSALADRGDVTEELIRLRSHMLQFRAALREREPAGRRLDFLTQELQRETHTMGAKSPAADLTARTVRMKEEVERIREQVQNLE